MLKYNARLVAIFVVVAKARSIWPETSAAQWPRPLGWRWRKKRCGLEENKHEERRRENLLKWRRHGGKPRCRRKAGEIRRKLASGGGVAAWRRRRESEALKYSVAGGAAKRRLAGSYLERRTISSLLPLSSRPVSRLLPPAPLLKPLPLLSPPLYDSLQRERNLCLVVIHPLCASLGSEVYNLWLSHLSCLSGGVYHHIRLTWPLPEKWLASILSPLCLSRGCG